MNIAIIGAGPAGLFSTLLLKDADAQVTLFEQNNRLGEKLRITGGGRMNVTNEIFGVDQFTSESARPLKHLFKSPWVKNRFDLLEELGIEYVWEKNRAILKSGDAVAEVERLTKKIEQQKNATISCGSKVVNIESDEGGFTVEYEKNNSVLRTKFDRIIISGGGMFRMFSREGFKEIYALPEQLGHSMTQVRPSLSPMRIKENPFKPLSGTAMPLTLFVPGTKTRMTNDTLFTHFGLSGPLILDFTNYLPPGGDCAVCFMPEVSEEDFAESFQSRRSGKNLLRKFLQQFMPKKVADWHLEQLKLDKAINIADVSKNIFKDLKKNLYRYPISGAKTFPYSGCWTTRGGVRLDEVNVSSLESKKNPGLYFAGEVLDVNGLCGGYNISFAMISGKIISEAIRKSLDE